MSSDNGRPGDGETGDDDLASWLEEHFPASAPDDEAAPPAPPAAPDARAVPAAPASPAIPPASGEPLWPAVPSSGSPTTAPIPLPTPDSTPTPPPPPLLTPPPPPPPPATRAEAMTEAPTEGSTEAPTEGSTEAPTEALTQAPTQAFTPPALTSEAPSAVAGPESDAPSALDDLFGDTQFRDYDQMPAQPGTAATVALTQGTQGWIDPLDEGNVAPQRTPEVRASRTQKVMLWVAGSLVAVLGLVALFLVGTRIPDLLGPAPAVIASATPTPTPTPTETPVGPVEAGEYHWDELLGGECLEPYTGPWADDFTVVDCSVGHAAQLVSRGSFDLGDDEFAPYPGIEALQAQINLLCTSTTVISYAAAGKFDDIQFEASYAATPQEWSEGQHDYFCFVSRISGDPITGTVAVPPVIPAPSPSPSA